MVEGFVRPVGSPHEEKLDVRILATCQRPARLIPDLRARLSGAVLEVPPLRARAHEFPALVEKMLRGRRRITCDAVAELARAPWEGNLPELEAAIERMVAASEDPIGLKLVRRILKRPEMCRHRRLVDKKRRLAEMASALA
jgi:two-component system nitrogen regulation response regulator GlnG